MTSRNGRNAAGQTLDRVLAERAARRPERRAVVLRDAALTFGQLEERAGRIGAALVDLGVEPGQPVGLLARKSPDAIAAIFGILRAGGAYVPLDPDTPVLRLERMVERSGMRCLVTVGAPEDGGPAPLRAVPGLRELRLSDPGSGEDADLLASVKPLAPGRATARDLAYLLFTSGSTGEPKGVPIRHENVAAFLDWAVPYFGMTEDDRISGHPPLYFDLSAFDVFGAARAGAELHLVDPESSLLPQKLIELMRDQRLTQWFSVPAVYNLVARYDLLRDETLPDLRRALWCGEVLPSSTLSYWMERLPDVTFTNLYGPTETTIASSYHTVDTRPADAGAAIPIGRACGGEEIFLLDESLALVAPGELGELCIAGTGLSDGYWSDPERTTRAFVEIEVSEGSRRRVYRTGDMARLGEDGLLHFHGRQDSQIKSRGYRIELGDIEHALQSLDIVRDCAVVAIDREGLEGKLICCAFVGAARGVDGATVRSALSTLLPAYMLPRRWMELDALPRNLNGKVDRPMLRAHFEKSAASVVA